MITKYVFWTFVIVPRQLFLSYFYITLMFYICFGCFKITKICNALSKFIFVLYIQPIYIYNDNSIYCRIVQLTVTCLTNQIKCLDPQYNINSRMQTRDRFLWKRGFNGVRLCPHGSYDVN